MDRERLKQVERADLNESRVNEDFLLWLKNKGPTWLLVVLVGVSAYLLVVRYRQGKTDHRNRAWAELASSRLPDSLEDVADDYPDVDQVARLAWMQAAEQLVAAVQANRSLDAPAPDPLAPTAPVENSGLTDENREHYLARAERLYNRILDGDDGSFELALHMGGALNGLAAIAESRGDAESAIAAYARAADRLEADYPALADQARRRGETVNQSVREIVFLPKDQIDSSIDIRPVRESPIVIDSVLQSLWQGDEDGATP